MNARRKVASRRVTPTKAVYSCTSGPFKGYAIALTVDSGSCSAWIQVQGQIGRYEYGIWETFKREAP